MEPVCHLELTGIFELTGCIFMITDINECDSNPCMNGALCHNEVNAYNCTCADGYTGYMCETGKCICRIPSP